MSTSDSWTHVRRLGIDTAPFIYYVEDHLIYAPLLERLIQRLDAGSLQGVVSALALTECWSRPFQEHDFRLIRLYRTLFTTTTGLLMQSVTPAIAERAAQLRAYDGLHPSAAIHVATAVELGCDAFLTNDQRLARSVAIPIMLLEDVLSL